MKNKYAVIKELAPYMRSTDFATGPKDFDHEDVETEFTSDGTLSTIANILASIGVFALLMTAIAVVVQVIRDHITR